MMPYTLSVSNSLRMPDLNDFITTQEAAALLGFNVMTVRHMLRDKKLDGVKVAGKTWLVSKKSILEYKEQNDGLSKNDPRRGR